jgi:hypothetical protein
MAIKRADFPLPDVDDRLTAVFFAGAARGELVIPRCESCNRFVWYPAAECAACGSREAPRWTAVSGDGTLFSWAVLRRAFLPAFEEAVPFVTALVALAEDPAVRLCTYIVDAEPSELEADAPVRAVFRPLTFPTVPDKAVTVPMFELVSRA